MKYIDADLLQKEINRKIELLTKAELDRLKQGDKETLLYYSGKSVALDEFGNFIDSLTQEQSKIDLKEFTQKMNDWKARYTYPDRIPIKATMAFTARMFYMYPDIAREWYDGLPKATQD